MEILEFFSSPNKANWAAQMRNCDWGAGRWLGELLEQGRLAETLGDGALVLMLTENERLVSFCTYAPEDDIQPTDLHPWVGFFYTFPEYRGRHLGGRLLEMAEALALAMEKQALYISTGETGLYEVYGYSFFRMEKDVWGEDSRVYRKVLSPNEALLNKGYDFKAGIVAAARKGIDPVAYCGFSCNHCFLGKWCGGCKSFFNCCSFGTLYPKNRCPNITCCRERGYEGCYACPDLAGCKVGFYADGNDGAIACKAQAMFIAAHGKQASFAVHDRLHEKQNFAKTQEILGPDLEKAREILENCWNEVKENGTDLA